MRLKQDMLFKHFIITRYNLGLYTSNPYKIPSPERWMKWRYDLFAKYTYPSVKSQTKQNFTWVVSLDIQTPVKEVEQLMELAKGFKNLQFILGRPLLWLKEQIIKEPWIITTRLDSDDMIEPEFIGAIQGMFRGEEKVIDTLGRQLDVKTGKYCKTGRKNPNSPFVSLIERTKQFKTVLHHTHSTLYLEHGGEFANSKEPLYTQVIHDHNLMNKLTGLWL